MLHNGDASLHLKKNYEHESVCMFVLGFSLLLGGGGANKQHVSRVLSRQYPYELLTLFVTRHGMMIYHYELACYVKKIGLLSSRLP